jgi:hypothetical protein
MNMKIREPNAWKYDMEKTQFYRTGKEEFMSSTSQGHRSTGRICTYPGFEKAEEHERLHN